MLWPSVRSEFESALASSPMVEAGLDEEQWLRPRLRRLPQNWSLPAVAALPGQTEAQAQDGIPSVDYDWVGSGARAAGTLVHRCLQYAADGRIELDEAGLESLRPACLRWLQGMGVATEMHDSVLERAFAAFRSALNDEHGRRLMRGEGHTELALTGVIDGRLVSSVIDRVLIEGQTHWVVDYKTSSHEGGDLQGFLAAEADRYRPQLEQYASVYRAWSGHAPRLALYFPLLGRFIEVSPGR